MLARYRILVVNCILLLALTGSYWGQRVESISVQSSDFLGHLNLPFRDWATSDVALTPSEREQLQPDAVLVRRYRSRDGEEAELAVIAGHRKRTVHNPNFCMAGGGWETLSQERFNIALPDRKLWATRALMMRSDHQLIATYFFTDGDYTTGSLIRFHAAQLLKRFGAEVPMGALVRILVPVRGDQAMAAKLSVEFARATLPGVMDNLRHARLQKNKGGSS